jgi:hypothetical protein
VLAVGLTACGDAYHRPAAVVHGVDITDQTVKETTPSARVLTTLLRRSCGTQAPGEPARSPCLRYTVAFLIQRAIVRAYAVQHDLRVRPYEVERTIDRVRNQNGTEQVQAILDQFGVDEADFEALVREQLLVGRVQEAVASDAVGEDQLRAAYRRQRADFTLLHAAHILVPTRTQAQRIAEQVTPENFEELAKRFSIDKVSAEQGGDLGTIPVGQLDSDFVRGALALQPGEISEPVQSRFGWHIIRLLSVRTASFESVRDQLLQQLQGPAIETWFLDQLRDGVEVNPRYGRLDPRTGDVVPLDSTATALPSPSASGP